MRSARRLCSPLLLYVILTAVTLLSCVQVEINANWNFDVKREKIGKGVKQIFRSMIGKSEKQFFRSMIGKGEKQFFRSMIGKGEKQFRSMIGKGEEQFRSMIGKGEEQFFRSMIGKGEEQFRSMIGKGEKKDRLSDVVSSLKKVVHQTPVVDGDTSIMKLMQIKSDSPIADIGRNGKVCLVCQFDYTTSSIFRGVSKVIFDAIELNQDELKLLDLQLQSEKYGTLRQMFTLNDGTSANVLFVHSPHLSDGEELQKKLIDLYRDILVSTVHDSCSELRLIPIRVIADRSPQQFTSLTEMYPNFNLSHRRSASLMRRLKGEYLTGTEKLTAHQVEDLRMAMIIHESVMKAFTSLHALYRNNLLKKTIKFYDMK